MKVISYGNTKEVYITPKEQEAMEMIDEYKDLRLPPQQLLKELQKAGYSLKERKNARRAYNLKKAGGNVEIKTESSSSARSHFQSDSYSRRAFDIG